MGGTMRWAELRMCRFWAGGISSFPFSRAREYRLLRRLCVCKIYKQIYNLILNRTVHILLARTVYKTRFSRRVYK